MPLSARASRNTTPKSWFLIAARISACSKAERGNAVGGRYPVISRPVVPAQPSVRACTLKSVPITGIAVPGKRRHDPQRSVDEHTAGAHRTLGTCFRSHFH
jgi:hypothetical protein